jgi:hypothetical protein
LIIRLKMTKEEIRKQMLANISHIGNLTIENAELARKLERLELEDWQPDAGDFVVETTGNIFVKYSWPTYSSEAVNSEINFGSVRTTQKRAEMASKNMRMFNRLSCYMGDLNPVIEFSDMCVKLAFYDYDSDKVKKLKKILEVKGEL